MKQCNCWHEQKTIVGWINPDKPKYRYETVCWGTKECDVCSCGGDRRKCDFYDYVRKEAKAEEQSELDKMELEFYRYYLLKNDLVWDAAQAYEKWKKNKGNKR